ncbi:MAG: hypothetical protein HYW08_13210 [candidate division NC10 bacterium]|nr:hypothetical protein [candidate division NC10 bacterium]
MPGIEGLTRFVHLLASMVYLGGSWFLGAALIPGLRAMAPEQRIRTVAAVIRWYHPTSLAALGILVMTGAFTLTSAKAALGPQYFSTLFTLLGPKLLLAFVLGAGRGVGRSRDGTGTGVGEGPTSDFEF